MQVPIRMLKSVMRPWCDLCEFARSGTRLNDLGSGNLPLRRIHLTPNTKSAPSGGFRSSNYEKFTEKSSSVARHRDG